MKKIFFIISLTSFFVVGFAIAPAFAESPAMMMKDMVKKYMPKYKKSEIMLHDTMRMLWEQHVMWTRMVIIDITDDVFSRKDADTKRLLKNYADMADALKPFYGVKKAEEFGELMEDHLTIAAELVQMQKIGNPIYVSDVERRWYTNADELAVFLNKANPKFWSKKSLQDMLYNHLKMTREEAIARINRNSSADIAIYDAIEVQALVMADILSDGLIKQFPKKFNSNSKGWENYKEPDVKVLSNTVLGGIVVAGNGMTLYTTKNDAKNMSNCYGVCAQNWPPFILSGKLVKNPDMKGNLETIRRTDGMIQITYQGWPLYFWIGDKKKGDITGNGVNDVWSVVTP